MLSLATHINATLSPSDAATTVATSSTPAYAGGFAFPWMGGTRTFFSGTAAAGMATIDVLATTASTTAASRSPLTRFADN